MQILSAAQIHAWDEYTIRHEPISSVDLMERASTACADWLMQHGYDNRQFSVYCGKGNNGGDGLVIARLLAASGHDVEVYIAEFGHKGTGDFQINLERLHTTDAHIRFVSEPGHLKPLTAGHIIVDALFGSGLNRKPEGLNQEIIQHLNNSGAEIISIDVPSGMSADQSSKGYDIIRARHTLSFQRYKLAFLVPENESYCGKIHILDIGLHPGFRSEQQRPTLLTDTSLIAALYRPRNNFAHKGSYGHSLIVAGSHGKIGAAVLATRACLHSGTGLCTVHVPGCGYEILQLSAPEAMVLTDTHNNMLTTVPGSLERYTAVGVGPGIGRDEQTAAMLKTLISSSSRPMVIDADAINILADNPEWLSLIPPMSVLTPHPKEFERLFGKTDNDFDRIRLAADKAKAHNLIIILKGHHTLIATPNADYFNNTGNAGMASGGTGDTLTGIITALLSQQYPPEHAAVMGVYIHGLAGDLAAKDDGMEFLLASELIRHLGKAFMSVASIMTLSSIQISGTPAVKGK